MRTIDITTTQNVTIEYELAPLRDRIFGYMMDQLIMGAVMLLMMLFYFGIFEFRSEQVFAFFFALPLFFFYTLISEIVMDGQTLGKKIIGTKVVKLNGKEPTAGDYVIRWVFRMVDIYGSVGTIASMLISSSDKAQRLGGITSGTTVIKVKFNLRFRLEDIERISSLESYTPSYPQVLQLDEKDMLLIKTVISRHRKYPNESHIVVMDNLVDKLTTLLEIEHIPRNKPEFLKTLIRDYIVLTR